MTSRSFIPFCFVLAACASADAPPEPTAPDAPSTIPRDPAGAYALTTTLDVPVPEAARPVLDFAQRATDGADDPMGFAIERVVDGLPDGTTKSVIQFAAPFIVAYLDERVDELAPRFAPGVRAIATGLARVATHVELAETLTVERDGDARRAITGARFDVAVEAPVLAFAAHGLADVTAATRVTLDRAGGVAIDRHTVALPYGALVRLGLDAAVIPAVEPRARDLASALALLVDCPHLGALVADELGVGSAELYGGACAAGMTALANELYEGLDGLAAAPLALELSGTADGFDTDGDGTLDELRAGAWTGNVSASFAGARVR